MPSSLLKDASRADLYHLPAPRRLDLLEMVNQANFLLLTADVGACHGIGEVLVDFGKALHFPPWYGTNLDALHDCLSDPDWHPERGVVILISGLEALRRRDPENFPRLLDVLAAACRSRSAGQPPLWVLSTTPARGLASLPEA
ncbi:MAG: barstar family protein [Bacteroidota bacterium]